MGNPMYVLPEFYNSEEIEALLHQITDNNAPNAMIDFMHSTADDGDVKVELRARDARSFLADHYMEPDLNSPEAIRTDQFRRALQQYGIRDTNLLTTSADICVTEEQLSERAQPATPGFCPIDPPARDTTPRR